MSQPFVLDRTLNADTHVIGDLPLSRVLLMNDARFPWVVLVPRVCEVRELIDLAQDLQHRLLDEIQSVAHAMRKLHSPLKLNIAMLGNVVAQLHVHVIARYAHDAAWPKPVWGVGLAEGYARKTCAAEVLRWRAALGGISQG